MNTTAISTITPEDLATAKKATFGYRVVTLTEPAMNKGGKMGVAPNPLYGRTAKLTTYYNMLLGADYGNNVNLEREREGKPTDFVSGSQRGTHYFDAFFNESDKEIGAYYLKMGYRRNGSKTSFVYLVDGRPATEDEIRTIEYYLKPKSDNKSQGVENPYKHFHTKGVNVLYVAQGEKVFFRSERLDEYTDLLDFTPKDFEVACSMDEYEAMMAAKAM